MDCQCGYHCPYLKDGNVWRLIAEQRYLSQRLDEIEGVMAVAEAKIENLRQENQKLTEENKRLTEENKSLRYHLKQMLGKIFKRQVKPASDVNRPQRGAPPGHRGNSRRRPEEVSEFVDIYPNKCDRCGGAIETHYETNFDEHVVEDIEIRKRVTCYRLHYGYCKRCQKPVRAEGHVNPNDRIGIQARAVGGYLRYLGLTYGKAARLFRDVFDLNLTRPSFMAFNAEQAQNGIPLYEAIKQLIRHSPYVNADETGWRVNGQNHWLWVFTNKEASLYHIDESRGGKVVTGILGEKYQGVLGCDFYPAYNELVAKLKQRCLGHLLSEIKKVQEKNQFDTEGIDGKFCHELKTILKELIDIRNSHLEEAGVFDALARAKDWAIPKMTDLLSSPIEHEDTQRLRNRIIRHNQELFPFLDDPSIEPTNNRAERQLRPMVIMRKLTNGNRSDLGALNQAAIMSIVETAILNHVEPLDIFLALSLKPLTSFAELAKARPP